MDPIKRNQLLTAQLRAQGAPTNELERILALPQTQAPTAAELNACQHMFALGPALARGFRLRPIQIQAVLDYANQGGLFAPIGVGHGKTLISLLIAQHAYATGKRRILLLLPSAVHSQFAKVDIPKARHWVPMLYPIHHLVPLNPKQREAAGKYTHGLWVLSYALLSQPDAPGLLRAINPDLIICDEAHNLAKYTAARTRRLMDYVGTHNPQGVCMSGTMTGKSIRDYAHLIDWCLGRNSPLPRNGVDIDNWAAVLDTTGTHGYFPAAIAKTLDPLRQWAGIAQTEQADYRRAYQKRLRATEGVVATSDASVACGLVLRNDPVPTDTPGFETLTTLMAQVIDEYRTPNDDDIAHAIHTYKWLSELTAGFYNKLQWPTADALAQQRGITPTVATGLLERAKQRHKLKQRYTALLRDYLKEPHPKYDTPFLVGGGFSTLGARAPMPGVLYDAWCDYRNMDDPALPLREAEVVRVCPYKIDAAVAWAKKHGNGLMWVHHQAVGRWLADALTAAGVTFIYCTAGDTRILDPTNAGVVCVASIEAHGTGKNLQHHKNQYFVQWPRDARMAEQTLGRTHRQGQKAACLYVDTNFTGDWDYQNFAACLIDALYVHHSTGNRQKLAYATYDPLPPQYPHAVLKQNGFQPAVVKNEVLAAFGYV